VKENIISHDKFMDSSLIYNSNLIKSEEIEEEKEILSPISLNKDVLI